MTMSDPVVELELATERQKDDDESVSEYVARLGDEADVDEALVDDAAAYATEWFYSGSRPADDEAFEQFLAAVRGADLLSDDLEQRKAPSSKDVTIDELRSESSSKGAGRNDATVASTETGDASAGDTATTPSPEDTTSDDSLYPSFKTGLQGSEARLLVLRFLAIVVTAPLLGWMMGRAWVPGNAIYDQLETQLAGLFGIPPDLALQFATAFGFGLFVALLLLFTVDPKKRVQGILLVLATALSVGVMATMGIFLPNMDFADPLVLLGLGLGVAVGLISEADELYGIDLGRSSLGRPTIADGRVAEFRTAAFVLFALVAILVVVTLGQVVLAGSVHVADPIASGVFLVLSYQFIQYESETSYMTLGPERSGKSTMMLALCLELLTNAETDPKPNTYLASSLERASNIRQGEERWPLPSTPHDEARVTSFEVVAGNLFPRRLELTALDYAGQHLGRVASYLADGDRPDADSTATTVADWIDQSERLLFILDVERLVYPEKFGDVDDGEEANISWGLEHYATIIEATDPDDVIVVATKCDILIDQRDVSDPATLPSDEAFRQAVTDHLATRPDVERLLDLTGEEEIIPVYIETKRQNGEYVPRLDHTGNLMPVGYDALIEEIRTRQ